MLDYRGVVQMPALGFVQLALNHTIHDRGQLSVHLGVRRERAPDLWMNSSGRTIGGRAVEADADAPLRACDYAP